MKLSDLKRGDKFTFVKHKTKSIYYFLTVDDGEYLYYKHSLTSSFPVAGSTIINKKVVLV